MARINLLPWRAEQKKQRQQAFIIQIVMGLVVAGLTMLAMHMHMQGLIEHQQQRNTMLSKEIAQLDSKIKEINTIEDRKNQLLTKINVIQQLQESRPEVVHLFDEIASLTPEGVFLAKFQQKGKSLVFDGKTESNARVSAFMRAVEASEWLHSPSLNIIQSKDKTQVNHLSDFTLQAKLGRQKKANAEKP
ncbi:MAG: PilN domain-containing protein [Methylococcales bacterium]|nr:PilN domain-containing protein [Methylococcales bacterium]